MAFGKFGHNEGYFACRRAVGHREKVTAVLLRSSDV
jgi:hypothetical protein